MTEKIGSMLPFIHRLSACPVLDAEMDLISQWLTAHISKCVLCALAVNEMHERFENLGRALPGASAALIVNAFDDPLPDDPRT